jgi:hypothetical protein
MTISEHNINGYIIPEIVATENFISSTEDCTDLLGNLYFLGYDAVILSGKHLPKDFFDLKTGIAGDFLQKFSNYRIRLAIIGEFHNIRSKSLKDFIFESNKNKQISFVSTLEEALERLSR